MTLLYSRFVDVKWQHMVCYQRTAEDRPSISRYLLLFVKHLRRHVHWTQLAPEIPRQNVMGVVTDLSLDKDRCFLLILKLFVKTFPKLYYITSASARRSRFLDSDSSPFDRTLLVVFNCSIISFINSPIGNTVPSLQVRVTSLTLLAEGAETGEDLSLIPFTRCVFTLIGLWIASTLGLFAGLTWAVVSWMALPSNKLSSTGMQSSSTSEHPSSSEFTLSKSKLRLGIIGHYYLMWKWEIFFVRESWSFQREALPSLQ